jgi:DNA-binding MarR family transcriptional regulator
MTRAEKVAKARELREQGALLREIAAELGVAVSTAGTLLSDPDGAKLRARKDSYRGTCEKCGTATDGSNGPGAAPALCCECTAHRHDERNHRIFDAWNAGDNAIVISAREGLSQTAVLSLLDTYRQKGAPVARRNRPRRELWPIIEQRWREGATASEIAAECDTTPGNVSEMVQSMREAGIDLPAHTGCWTDERRAQLVELWNAGRSVPTIADALDTTPSAVQSIVRRYRAAGGPLQYRRSRRAVAA